MEELFDQINNFVRQNLPLILILLVALILCCPLKKFFQIGGGMPQDPTALKIHDEVAKLVEEQVEKCSGMVDVIADHYKVQDCQSAEKYKELRQNIGEKFASVANDEKSELSKIIKAHDPNKNVLEFLGLLVQSFTELEQIKDLVTKLVDNQQLVGDKDNQADAISKTDMIRVISETLGNSKKYSEVFEKEFQTTSAPVSAPE